ncbi:ricin-type beta-trefoil lectin domain protein [Actinocrinis sp.]|uniref:ricin-type beta-trefoil lectin domain protein n=1 Tax=Actinocrinis sp. TaxID=1920516 RepID=UPI0039C85670
MDRNFRAQSNTCLDDTNRPTTPGARLQIWGCTGGSDQQWNLSSPLTVSVNRPSSRCPTNRQPPPLTEH